MKRLHSGASVVGALLASVAISACSTMSPIQTTEPYNPSDGVPATSGNVTARNLLVVADEKGGPGTLSGSVLNKGDESTAVSFQPQQAAAGVSGGPMQLDPREQQQITNVTFLSMPVAPGAWTSIYLVTSAGKTLVDVPVLAPNGFYEDLAPGGAGPTSQPTATATASATRG
ncbi:MAG: hypothetical protein ACOYBY_00745 [Dermatophilaceae bacterium]